MVRGILQVKIQTDGIGLQHSEVAHFIGRDLETEGKTYNFL